MFEIKRISNAIFALILLLCCAPVMIAISVLVAAEGMPIIFHHRRVGKDGRTFDCYKFRTMVTGFNLEEYLATHPAAALQWQQNQKLDNDPRTTWIGKWLRRLCLDELPQLVNIVRGEMNFVGPRPVTKTELGRYGEFACKYLSVRPGLTGLWQVSGRNQVSYKERVELDMQYIATQSAWCDLLIILKTVKFLISAGGR